MQEKYTTRDIRKCEQCGLCSVTCLVGCRVKGRGLDAHDVAGANEVQAVRGGQRQQRGLEHHGGCHCTHRLAVPEEEGAKGEDQ